MCKFFFFRSDRRAETNENLCNQSDRKVFPRQAAKKIPIRRVAIRETGISRHHEKAQIRTLAETYRTSQHYRIKRFKVNPNRAPIMSDRAPSYTSDQCYFSSFGSTNPDASDSQRQKCWYHSKPCHIFLRAFSIRPSTRRNFIRPR